MTKRRKKEWFDDESFWRGTFSFMFPPERFAAAKDEVDKTLKLIKPKGKAVLDLCCGPGRTSVELAKRKFKVTGVDSTPFLLRHAKMRANAARVKIEWVKEDMRDFVRPGAFDLILNMFTSFGFFEREADNEIVLQNMYTNLRPGGSALIDMMGKERLAKIFLPSNVDTLPDGSRLVQIREVYNDWTRLRNEWILVRRGRARSFHFDHTLYSGQEIKDRLTQVGFTNVRLYGNLGGDAYGPSSLRLVVVGRKA